MNAEPQHYCLVSLFLSINWNCLANIKLLALIESQFGRIERSPGRTAGKEADVKLMILRFWDESHFDLQPTPSSINGEANPFLMMAWPDLSVWWPSRPLLHTDEDVAGPEMSVMSLRLISSQAAAAAQFWVIANCIRPYRLGWPNKRNGSRIGSGLAPSSLLPCLLGYTFNILYIKENASLPGDWMSMYLVLSSI